MFFENNSNLLENNDATLGSNNLPDFGTAMVSATLLLVLVDTCLGLLGFGMVSRAFLKVRDDDNGEIRQIDMSHYRFIITSSLTIPAPPLCPPYPY